MRRAAACLNETTESPTGMATGGGAAMTGAAEGAFVPEVSTIAPLPQVAAARSTDPASLTMLSLLLTNVVETLLFWQGVMALIPSTTSNPVKPKSVCRVA